jgi:uncharacterized protein (TIGR02271 family)
MTMSTETVAQWRGADVIDQDGDKVGTVEEIYLDQQTDQPEWALVKTGLFGGKSTFVPLAGANPEGDNLRVPFDKERIKDAPKIDPEQELSQQEEHELYSYYGMDYGESQSDTGLPEGGAPTAEHTETEREPEPGGPGQDVSGPNTDNAMTRSEEELRIGKTQQERGRVRLKKYVVTDHVQQTVPVQREEVRVEREPITDANAGNATDGPAISEEEHEVTLHEEVPVADKVAVPKERVRLDKDTVTDEETVSGEVRQERIDVDDQGGTAR